MSETEKIYTALKSLDDPHTGQKRDVTTLLESVFIAGNSVNCVLKEPVSAEIRSVIEKTIQTVKPFYKVKVLVTQQLPATKKPEARPENVHPEAGVQNVQHIIAIASGKGGVGKSTVTVNLAVSLAKMGYRVGLLDADIYGPSMPIMLGVSTRPDSPDGKTMIPIPAHGVSSLSIGYLLADQAPVVWRGPMVHSALQQMLNQAIWGALDLLLIDMPPGTGDTALTLAQHSRLSGAVVVTTPQNVALADARKAIEMFRKVDVTTLGIIENMAFHVCPHCQKQSAIFGSNGGAIEAKNQQVELLGQLPLQEEVCRQSDFGSPIVQHSDDYAQYFQEIATKLAAKLNICVEKT